MLDGKSILITGGTGSLGQALVTTILEKWPGVRRLVVLSRDELKQHEMAQRLPPSPSTPIRYFLGDVRNRERLKRAFKGVDIVIHAAALKQVPAAEYNPIEFIHTNVLGAENVVEAAIDNDVKVVVALSTDKAASPINLYGATKLCSDKLFVAANRYAGTYLKSCVVRYGNVMASRGSVIPLFLERAKTGELPITDLSMTRFSITLSHGVDLVLMAIRKTLGGEIFVPKIPSYRISDVAEAIGPSCRFKEVGIRPGEKIHEEMISQGDSAITLDHGDYFVIYPSQEAMAAQIDDRKSVGCRVPEGFSYDSGSNPEFLTVARIRELIVRHIDPKFLPL